MPSAFRADLTPHDDADLPRDHGNCVGAAPQGFRHARLSDVLRQELDSLLRDDVSDPALDAVSVSFVELSPDYRSAKVHVSTARVCAPSLIERALERATPFLRRNLIDAVELKFVPALRFAVTTGVSSQEDGDACE